MSKKRFLLFSVVIIIVFSYGLSVGHYKIFPFEQFSTMKSLISNNVHEDLGIKQREFEELARQNNVTSHIHINNEKDILDRKNALISYIWKEKGFPYSKMPTVQNNIHDPQFADLQNLKQINSLTIVMDYDTNSVGYLFEADKSNNKLIIYHQGHEGHDFYQDKEKIQFFLDKGYSVLIMVMVTHGMNNEPTVVLSEFGKFSLQSHDHFKFLDSKDFSSIKFFVEPVAIFLNYVDKQYDFDSYYMVGLSGGGWVTVLYSAIDDRIVQSYPVAGSIPIFLRYHPEDFGDYEQTLPDLYKIASYEDLYIMGSYGDGRKSIQIFNLHDPCCFSGDRIPFETYEIPIKARMNELGKGSFAIYVDGTIEEHDISQYALGLIIKEIEK